MPLRVLGIRQVQECVLNVKLQWLACIAMTSFGACAPDPISTAKGVPEAPPGSGDTMTGKIIGDFNSDGVVNSADLEIFKTKYNYMVFPTGDYNQDGVVDSADLIVYNSGSLDADGNANGKIDAGDLVVLMDNMNKGHLSHEAGDLDRDNDVDMDDFKVWRENEKKELEKNQ